MKTLISVIVPIYRVEKYLPACVDSILAQTYRDFELILVDDGSPDQCGSICDAYAKKDGRVRVIHRKNGGLSQARNEGLKAAKGAYIAFVDGDDIIHQDYLKLLHLGMEDPGVSVSVCHYIRIREENRFPQTDRHSMKFSVMTGREAAAEIVEKNKPYMITAWGKLYRSDMAPKLLYPAGKISEDEFVTYKVLYESEKVAVSMPAYYGYRINSGGIMEKSRRKRLDDGLQALWDAIGYFAQKGDLRLETAARKRYLLRLQICWFYLREQLPYRKELSGNLSELRKRHSTFYRVNRKQIKACCSPVEKVSVSVFRLSPFLYYLMAKLYLQIFPDQKGGGI